MKSKEISIFRLFKFSITAALTLTIIALIFGTGIASAESGTIDLTVYSEIPSYLTAIGGGRLDNQNLASFEVFSFDTAHYNTIDEFWVIVNPVVFSLTSNYTFFDCEYGCIGTGSVTYNKLGGIILWDFNPGFQVTASEFKLNYEESFFNTLNFNVGNVGSAYDTSPPTITKPMFVMHHTNYAYYEIDTPYTLNYNGTFGSLLSETYNIEYISSGEIQKFYGTITKSGLLQSKNIIESASLIYTQEYSFNNLTYNTPIMDYHDGLYINLTLSDGNYTRVLINSTGVPGYEPTPEITINPETHGGLLWNKNNYSTMEIGTLSYQYDSGLFENWFSHWITIYSNDNEVQKFEDLGVSGSISYQFPSPGSYSSKYYKCLFLICIFPSLLDEKTVQVSNGAPTQIFPASAYEAGIPKNISYYLNPYTDGDFFFEAWNEGSKKYVPVGGSWGTPTGHGNKSFTCGLITTYKIKLGDAVAYTKCIVNNSNAPYNISTSFLNISSTTPNLLDYLNVEYGISSSVWIGNEFYLKVYDKNNVNVFTYLISKQYQDIPFFLTYTAHDGFDMVVSTGINTISMQYKNGTVISSKTFTVSEINDNGYGLIFDKNLFCTGEKIKFKYYAPASVNLSLYKDEKYVGKMFLPASVNGNNSYFIHQIPGIYDVRLTYTGITYANGIITIDSCVLPIPGKTISPTDILGNVWFYASIITISFALAGGAVGGVIGLIGGFSIGVVFAFIAGFIPLWALFLFVLVIIVMLSLMISSKISGGN